MEMRDMEYYLSAENAFWEKMHPLSSPRPLPCNTELGSRFANAGLSSKKRNYSLRQNFSFVYAFFFFWKKKRTSSKFGFQQLVSKPVQNASTEAAAIEYTVIFVRMFNKCFLSLSLSPLPTRKCTSDAIRNWVSSSSHTLQQLVACVVTRRFVFCSYCRASRLKYK